MVPFAFGLQEVTISWDPNTEGDIEGYAVYLQEGVSGPLYDFLVDLPIDEMDDPDVPQVTLTELEPDTEYYVVVTAYDADGNESSYSDELCFQVTETSIIQCGASVAGSGGGDSSSSSGGGGSGGGGGCFIQNAGTGFMPRDGMPILVIILISGFGVYFMIRRLESAGRRRI